MVLQQNFLFTILPHHDEEIRIKQLLLYNLFGEVDVGVEQYTYQYLQTYYSN